MINQVSRKALVANVLIANKHKMMRSRDIYEALLAEGYSISISDVDYSIWRLQKSKHAIRCTTEQPAFYKAAEILTIDVVEKIRIANKPRTKSAIVLKHDEQIVYNNKYDQLFGNVSKIQTQNGKAYSGTMKHNLRLTSRNKVYVGSSFNIV
jgi:hypothetical protein